MTLGGVILIGLTLLVAAMDGGLMTLAAAFAIGGGAYALTRRTVNRVPAAILATQKRILEGQLADEVAKVKAEAGAKPAADAKIKALVAETRERSEALEKTLETQRWGNKEMAAAVGVGSFACPALGAVVVLAATSDTWLPRAQALCAWVDRHKTAAAAPQAGYFTRTGAFNQPMNQC